MKLVRLGKGTWDVLGVCDSRGRCHVTKSLLEIGARSKDLERLSRRALALLEQRLPQHGPPKNREISKHLQNGIFEFRYEQGKGKRLRILWFYDDDHVIFCTQAFLKDQPKTNPNEIERAELVRETYLNAKRRGDITIVEQPGGLP